MKPAPRKKRPESPLLAALRAQLQLVRDGWMIEDRIAWKSTKTYMKPGLRRRAKDCRDRARGLNKVIKVLIPLTTVEDKKRIKYIAGECRKLARRLNGEK